MKAVTWVTQSERDRIGLPDLEEKRCWLNVNCRSMMHNFLVGVCPKYFMRHTYVKNILVVYMKLSDRFYFL